MIEKILISLFIVFIVLYISDMDGKNETIQFLSKSIGYALFVVFWGGTALNIIEQNRKRDKQNKIDKIDQEHLNIRRDILSKREDIANMIESIPTFSLYKCPKDEEYLKVGESLRSEIDILLGFTVNEWHTSYAQAAKSISLDPELSDYLCQLKRTVLEIDSLRCDLALVKSEIHSTALKSQIDETESFAQKEISDWEEEALSIQREIYACDSRLHNARIHARQYYYQLFSKMNADQSNVVS